MSNFYHLKVVEVNKETSDSVSVAFDMPEDLYSTFDFKSGQYLTLKFNIDGQEVRRSYSLCSSPILDEYWRIGVKRVEKGLVSNYINDHVKVGDTIEVMPPNGRFFVETNESNYKTYYLFSAGSGITPTLSIAKTILNGEQKSFVHMIFGNRNQDSIMFKAELDQLQKDFPERFILIHTLSRPKNQWSDLWSTNDEFRKGRVDAEAVKWFINEYPPYAQNVEYYICGPEPMIEGTKTALQQIDVPEERIFIESFGGAKEDKSIQGVANAKLTAHLNGQKIETTVSEGKTVLRSLIDAGHNPPYSCEGGVCSTCVCQLKSGTVKMKKNMALSDDEVKSGKILSCQSIVTSESIEVDFK